MTKRETTSLLVKLMGIYCLVQLAPSLLHVLKYPAIVRASCEIWQKALAVGAMIVSPVVWIVFCLLIIRKSDAIARRLYPVDADASQLSALGFRELQLLGYNFIGAVLLVQSFPQLVEVVTSIRMHQWYTQDYHMTGAFYQNVLPSLLKFLAQFIIGVVLFLKPQRVAKLCVGAQPDK